MTIKDIYEKAKELGREDYEIVIEKPVGRWGTTHLRISKNNIKYDNEFGQIIIYDLLEGVNDK